MNNVLETDLDIAHELMMMKTDIVGVHGNLITIKSDLGAVKNDIIGIDDLTCSLLGRHLGEVSLVPENMQVKSDCDKDPMVKPPVASTSGKTTSMCASPSANMDKSVQSTREI